MAGAFNDRTNRMLYFDRSDTAQVVVDAGVALQVYNILASRDTSPATKVAIAGGGLLAGNYLYSTVLRNAVQMCRPCCSAARTKRPIHCPTRLAPIGNRTCPPHTQHTEGGWTSILKVGGLAN